MIRTGISNITGVLKLVMPVLFALVFVAFSDVASAKLIVKEQTKYYNVVGRTGKQLHSKLGRRGPWNIRRRHAIAATVRTFEFKNIKFSERNKKCVLTNVDVHLYLTYYFPKWTNKRQGSAKLQKLWDQFSRELVRHEQTHGRYFKETMRQFEKELLRTTGRISNDCEGMLKSAKARLNKIDARGEARHEAFDVREKKASARVRKLEKAIVRTK